MLPQQADNKFSGRPPFIFAAFLNIKISYFFLFRLFLFGVGRFLPPPPPPFGRILKQMYRPPFRGKVHGGIYGNRSGEQLLIRNYGQIRKFRPSFSASKFTWNPPPILNRYDTLTHSLYRAKRAEPAVVMPCCYWVMREAREMMVEESHIFWVFL